MNDLETRLRLALADAVPVAEPAADLLRTAAVQAVRLRRRRLARRGVLAAVAVATGGVVVTRPPADPPADRVSTAASTEPSAAPSSSSGPGLSAASVLTLRLVRECPEKLSEWIRETEVHCERLELDASDPDGLPMSYVLTVRTAPADVALPAARSPRALTVRYADGSSRTAEALPRGEDRWVFEIAPRPGKRIVRFDIDWGSSQDSFHLRPE